LRKFGKEVEYLHQNLKCTAALKPVEHYLTLTMVADGKGHVQVSGTATHMPGHKTKLEFDFVVEQDELHDISRALLAAEPAE